MKVVGNLPYMVLGKATHGEVSHKRHSHRNHLRRVPGEAAGFWPLYSEEPRYKSTGTRRWGSCPQHFSLSDPNTRTGRQSFLLKYVSLYCPLLTKLNTCQLVTDKYLKCPNPFHRAGKKDKFGTEGQ